MIKPLHQFRVILPQSKLSLYSSSSSNKAKGAESNILSKLLYSLSSLARTFSHIKLFFANSYLSFRPLRALILHDSFFLLQGYNT
jgi:hypothetical protein